MCHGAGRGGVDRLAAFTRDVQPCVEIVAAGDRIGAVSHRGGEPPLAGQIDGVAAASALRRSTLRLDDVSRDSRPSRSVRRRPNVSSGVPSDDSVRCAVRSASVLPPIALAFTTREVCPSSAPVRIERRPCADVLYCGFKGRDLRGELVGGGTETRILQFEGLMTRLEIGDVALGPPRSTDTDQHRNAEHKAGNDEHWAQRDGRPAHNA